MELGFYILPQILVIVGHKGCLRRQKFSHFQISAYVDIVSVAQRESSKQESKVNTHQNWRGCTEKKKKKMGSNRNP